MVADVSAVAGEQTPRKAVLICPTCGHESPPDGDWLTRRRETVDGEKVALVCPACETDITHRPAGEIGCEASPAPAR